MGTTGLPDRLTSPANAHATQAAIPASWSRQPLEQPVGKGIFERYEGIDGRIGKIRTSADDAAEEHDALAVGNGPCRIDDFAGRTTLRAGKKDLSRLRSSELTQCTGRRNPDRAIKIGKQMAESRQDSRVMSDASTCAPAHRRIGVPQQREPDPGRQPAAKSGGRLYSDRKCRALDDAVLQKLGNGRSRSGSADFGQGA
jgi:hypothetical protein